MRAAALGAGMTPAAAVSLSMTRNRIRMDVFSQVVTMRLVPLQMILIGRLRPCDCQLGSAVFASASAQGN